jgi:hypothetical protein
MIGRFWVIAASVTGCRSSDHRVDAEAPIVDAAPKLDPPIAFTAAFVPSDASVGESVELRLRIDRLRAEDLHAVSVVSEADADWKALDLIKTFHNHGTLRDTLRDAGPTPTKALDLDLEVNGHGYVKITMTTVARTPGNYAIRLYPTSQGERLKTPAGDDYSAVATLRIRRPD